jgi:hypothetical protein
MRHSRAALAAIIVLVAPAALVAACSGTGGVTPTTSSTSTGSGGAGGNRGDGGPGAGGSGGNLFMGDAATCSTAADCDGGVCVDGVCCDSAAHVCGGACCGGGTVCLFDKCVLPGKDCHTANDCSPGQYCETALGEGTDGGPAPADAACSQPPLGGKCLDLPPICDADAGAPGPDAGCVAACEYHPKGGNLNAAPKWTWDPTTAQTLPNFTDVWSTPTVGRVHDGNCDGKVDLLDSPNVIFVSGKAIDAATGKGTCCQCTGNAVSACLTGVLRMLDGRTGQEVWSLDKASANSSGFAGLSVAIGDVDKDGKMDILAVTGEGFIVLLDADGKVLRTSDKPIPGHGNATFGWGGGLAIADMDGDGFPEIAYGPTVFSTKNGAITLLFTGAAGIGGGGIHEALSTFVDLDGAPDNHLELLAGNTAYNLDGSMLWNRSDISDGFPGIGDFDGDGKPEAALVGNGQLWILDGATGVTKLGPVKVPGTGSGGPPTVADFDGDGKPEIGVAMATFYSMLKPDFAGKKIDVVWQTPNHDLSSSVTGSSVFDFEGDGKAEVIYGDECFLWVFDGATGDVRFATPHTSFTATEASLVADIDGDGRAEMLMVSNGSDPSPGGSWPCNVAPWNQVDPDPHSGHPAWVAPPGAPAYRGIVAFGDKANSWVGTRTLWNQHTYHVSNVCDDRDTACSAPNVYGSIPTVEKSNWTLPWLNNFRQNVQDKGLFDAPDATVSINVDCADPVVVHASVRNVGLSSLPTGAEVDVYKKSAGADVLVGSATTTHALFPGQTEELAVTVDGTKATKADSFFAVILVDTVNPKFHECREDNNQSQVVKASCVQ